MNFQAGEKKLQTAWKLTAKGLSKGDKRPSLYRNRMYPFCLPLEHAACNLFHEIREDALATFNRYNIIWHSSALPGLPSNHIGDTNYLNEEPKIGEYRKRDAGNTSIDATVMYENSVGEKVMLLIEIKYSESYGTSYKHFRSDGTDRFKNYEPFFYGEETPINLSVAPRLQDFLYEPFYQLLRQTLLAGQIMKTGKPQLSRVQVVHLCVNRNKELLTVTSPRFGELGNTTYEVWQKVLKDPSGFTLL
jgi:hypothetical protein